MEKYQQYRTSIYQLFKSCILNFCVVELRRNSALEILLLHGVPRYRHSRSCPCARSNKTHGQAPSHHNPAGVFRFQTPDLFIDNQQPMLWCYHGDTTPPLIDFILITRWAQIGGHVSPLSQIAGHSSPSLRRYHAHRQHMQAYA